ncbi:MAG: hypothetical protein ACKUBY_01705 [Candidatus Moraniibacteriota bacterium]|jgi:hypothetical protein
MGISQEEMLKNGLKGSNPMQDTGNSLKFNDGDFQKAEEAEEKRIKDGDSVVAVENIDIINAENLTTQQQELISQHLIKTINLYQETLKKNEDKNIFWDSIRDEMREEGGFRNSELNKVIKTLKENVKNNSSVRQLTAQKALNKDLAQGLSGMVNKAVHSDASQGKKDIRLDVKTEVVILKNEIAQLEKDVKKHFENIKATNNSDIVNRRLDEKLTELKENKQNAFKIKSPNKQSVELEKIANELHAMTSIKLRDGVLQDSPENKDIDNHISLNKIKNEVRIILSEDVKNKYLNQFTEASELEKKAKHFDRAIVSISNRIVREEIEFDDITEYVNDILSNGAVYSTINIAVDKHGGKKNKEQKNMKSETSQNNAKDQTEQKESQEYKPQSAADIVNSASVEEIADILKQKDTKNIDNNLAEINDELSDIKKRVSDMESTLKASTKDMGDKGATTQEDVDKLLKRQETVTKNKDELNAQKELLKKRELISEFVHKNASIDVANKEKELGEMRDEIANIDERIASGQNYESKQAFGAEDLAADKNAVLIKKRDALENDIKRVEVLVQQGKKAKEILEKAGIVVEEIQEENEVEIDSEVNERGLEVVRNEEKDIIEGEGNEMKQIEYDGFKEGAKKIESESNLEELQELLDDARRLYTRTHYKSEGMVNKIKAAFGHINTDKDRDVVSMRDDYQKALNNFRNAKLDSLEGLSEEQKKDAMIELKIFDLNEKINLYSDRVAVKVEKYPRAGKMALKVIESYKGWDTKYKIALSGALLVAGLATGAGTGAAVFGGMAFAKRALGAGVLGTGVTAGFEARAQHKEGNDITKSLDAFKEMDLEQQLASLKGYDEDSFKILEKEFHGKIAGRSRRVLYGLGATAAMLSTGYIGKMFAGGVVDENITANIPPKEVVLESDTSIDTSVYESDVVVEESLPESTVVESTIAEEIGSDVELMEVSVGVKSGDTLWGIIKNQLETNSQLAGMTQDQQTMAIDELKDKFAAMSSENLKGIGFESGDIHKIYPGNNLNLTSVMGSTETIQNAIETGQNFDGILATESITPELGDVKPGGSEDIVGLNGENTAVSGDEINITEPGNAGTQANAEMIAASIDMEKRSLMENMYPGVDYESLISKNAGQFMNEDEKFLQFVEESETIRQENGGGIVKSGETVGQYLDRMLAVEQSEGDVANMQPESSAEASVEFDFNSLTPTESKLFAEQMADMFKDNLGNGQNFSEILNMPIYSTGNLQGTFSENFFTFEQNAMNVLNYDSDVDNYLTVQGDESVKSFYKRLAQIAKEQGKFNEVFSYSA